MPVAMITAQPSAVLLELCSTISINDNGFPVLDLPPIVAFDADGKWSFTAGASSPMATSCVLAATATNDRGTKAAVRLFTIDIDHAPPAAEGARRLATPGDRLTGHYGSWQYCALSKIPQIRLVVKRQATTVPLTGIVARRKLTAKHYISVTDAANMVQ